MGRGSVASEYSDAMEFFCGEDSGREHEEARLERLRADWDRKVRETASQPPSPFKKPEGDVG